MLDDNQQLIIKDASKALHQKVGASFVIKNLTFTIKEYLKITTHTRVCICLGANNEEYVVKIINDDLDGDPYDYQLGELEYAETVESFFDASVLTYEIAERIDDVVVIVSKYRGISLADYRNKFAQQKLSLCEVLQILIRTSHGLSLLHSRLIIHSDIKPDNIFVNITRTDSSIPALSLTLGDLGIARSIFADSELESVPNDMYPIYDSSSDTYTYFRGSPGYIAPECMVKKSQTFASDVWSLGRLILKLLFPIEGSCQIQKYLDECTNFIQQLDLSKDEDVLQVISKGNLEVDIIGWRNVIGLVVSMLNYQPEKRPSCQQILKSIFPRGEIDGLVTLESQFKIIHIDFINNQTLQQFCVDLGVSLRMFDSLDRELVLKALMKNGMDLEFVDESFQKDREVIMIACKQNTKALTYADESFRKDRDFMMWAVVHDACSLEYAHESLKKDIGLVLTAVKQKGWVLEYADDSLKKDREIASQAVKQSGWALEFVDDSLKLDREIVIEAVKQDGLALHHAHRSLKKDREIVLYAVQENGWAIQYANEDLRRDDVEIMLTALSKCETAIKYSNELLRKNREFILQAVKKNGRSLEYAHESLKNDREILLEAVKQNGIVLQNADILWRKDREIVLRAVEQNGSALNYVDESLKKDREIVMAAVKQNGWALEYAHESFKKDQDVVHLAISQSPELIGKIESDFSPVAIKQNNTTKPVNVYEGAINQLYGAPSFYRKDKEIVLAAVKENGWALDFADESFKKDREIVLQAVTTDGLALHCADESLRKDREIVLQAITGDVSAIKLADPSLKNDREFILKAIEQDAEVLVYMDDQLKDRDFYLQAVQQNGLALEYMDESFRKDREIVLEAVTENGCALQYADESLKKDREVVIQAITSNFLALEYVDESLMSDTDILVQAGIIITEEGDSEEDDDSRLDE